jgi:hypothetical protein
LHCSHEYLWEAGVRSLYDPAEDQKGIAAVSEAFGPGRLKHPWGDELLPEDVRALRVDVQPENVAALVAAAEINHAVRPSPSFRGGVKHARRNLKIFLEQKLRDYAKESNQPARHGTSDLSPWQPVAEVWQTECLPHLGSQHIECRWWRRRFRLRSGRLWTSATGC